MTRDPVCAMRVYQSEAPAKAVHMGTTYYFCSLACREVFEMVVVKKSRVRARLETEPKRLT